MSVPAKSFAEIFNSGFWEGQHKFTDGTLQTDDGTSFKIHRVVLSQRSGYFRAYFSFNEVQETVVIPNINGEILESILLYIYTGTITLDEKNVWNLMIASDYLLLDDLLKSCLSFAIQNMTSSNCLSLLSLAWQIERLAITDVCYRYALVHFEDILASSNVEGFKELPIETFKTLLKSTSLNVNSEKSVWMAIVRWVEENTSSRLAHVPELLTSLRLKEGSDEELATEVLSHKIITDNHHCFDLTVRGQANRYQTKCSLISQYLRFEAICYYDSPYSYSPRVPNQLYIIARHSITATKYGSELYLTYDSKLDYWRQIGETDFFIDSMVQIGRCIYIFNLWQNINLIFDIFEEVFIPIRLPFGPENACGIIALNDQLYSIGGSRDGHDSTDMIYWYDAERNRWKSIIMTHHIIIYGAAALNGLIYIVGIPEFGLDRVLICRAYDPVRNEWISVPPPNIYRQGFAVVAFHKQVFVIAGENDGQYLKTVEVYDPPQNAWTSLPELPFQYFFPKAVVVDSKIIVYENHNEDTRYYEVCPPVYWDEKAHLWQIIDESSPLYSMERYSFLTLDDCQLVTEITAGNRGPGFKWERIPCI